jgi:ubiquinone/menaquinone biosynthesis C-methylase UbiE
MLLEGSTADRMSFERLAPHYTWMETVLAGSRLQRCRTEFLHELAGYDRILIAGVGHGHFLRAVTRRFPRAQITSVDASAGMLARARRRTGTRAGRLEYVHASLPEWQPARSAYDAIVTHFFLDCFEGRDLANVIGVLSSAARPQARWLLSDFAVPDRGWRRQRARAIHAAMYAIFRPIAGVRARRVTQPDPLLRAEGFTLQYRRSQNFGLLQSDVWSREGLSEPTGHCSSCAY